MGKANLVPRLRHFVKLPGGERELAVPFFSDEEWGQVLIACSQKGITLGQYVALALQALLEERVKFTVEIEID